MLPLFELRTKLRTILRLEVLQVTRDEKELPETGLALRQQAHAETFRPTPDCLDELAIADVVDGAVTADQRERLDAHLLRCARCRQAVRAVSSLASDASLQDEVVKRPQRRWVPAAVATAAAAAIVLLVMPTGESGRTVMREPAVTSTIAPVLRSPLGDVDALRTLIWSPVPGAERYRVHLQVADGTQLWTTTVEDTSAIIPDSVRLTPGMRYFWRVEAQTEWRRWVASPFGSFVGRRATP